MSAFPTSGTNGSAESASQLLDAMAASEAEHPNEADFSRGCSSERETPTRDALMSAGSRSASRVVPKVSLGPVLHDRLGKPHVVSPASRLESPGDLEVLRREMEVQEKIIVALQRDNESLLKDKKEAVALCKDLETKYEHLEAKHSLLLSAQQDLGARSNLRVSSDVVKVADLQARIYELQSALDSERAKRSPGASPAAALQQSRNVGTPVTAAPHPPTKATDDTSNEAPWQSSVADSDAQMAKLREYEKTHEVHKAMIDALHTEVERLELDKKRLEERQRHYVRQIDELTARTHELEDTVTRKKESIGELLRSCQDSAVHAAHVKKQAARIHSLEAALAEKDEFTRRAMERLRSESKEVCERYQQTIAALQSRPPPPIDDHELQAKITSLERENGELRRALESKGEASPCSTDGALSTQRPQRTEEKATLHVTGGAVSSGGTPPTKQSDVLRLEGMLRDAAAESAKEKQISSALQSELADIRTEWDARVRELKRSFASQFQLMRARHNEELERLEVSHRSEVSALAQQRREAEGDSFSAKLLSIVEKKGHDASLAAICERLHYLEKRSRHKEEAMAYELSEVQRISEMEKRVLKEQCLLQLEQKNTQIKAFRLQLDELLSSIAVLQATS